MEIDFLEFIGALIPGWQDISDEHLLMAFEKWKTGTDLRLSCLTYACFSCFFQFFN